MSLNKETYDRVATLKEDGLQYFISNAYRGIYEGYEELGYYLENWEKIIEESRLSKNTGLKYVKAALIICYEAQGFLFDVRANDYIPRNSRFPTDYLESKIPDRNFVDDLTDFYSRIDIVEYPLHTQAAYLYNGELNKDIIICNYHRVVSLKWLIQTMRDTVEFVLFLDLERKDMYDQNIYKNLHQSIKKNKKIIAHISNNDFREAADKGIAILKSKITSRVDNNFKSESQMMMTVFNENNPLIKINNLSTPTEISEQEGFKFLITGLFKKYRNKYAHNQLEEIDKQECINVLFMVTEYLDVLDSIPK